MAEQQPQAVFDMVRHAALALPGIEEGLSYGTPALRVRGKFIARLHEDGESLVLKIDENERDLLLLAEPDIYYVTDHYSGYPYVLIRLTKIHRDDLTRLLEQAWRRVAPKRLVTAYDQQR